MSNNLNHDETSGVRERGRTGSSAVPVAILLALTLYSPHALEVARLEKERVGGQASSEEIQRRNQSALASILGEARASLGDLLFIKTERYMHQGVAYAPHLDFEEMAHSGEVAHQAESGLEGVATPATESPGQSGGKAAMKEPDGHDKEEGRHHEGLTIRAAGEDFRGFLGNLERAVKPYEDPAHPHLHTTGEEILPWYRLITLTDPKNIRAYLIGATWLSQQGRRDKAVEFLREGMGQNEGNPEQFRLRVGLVTMLAKSRVGAILPGHDDWLNEALQEAKAAYAQALERRPEGGKLDVERNGLVWREDLEDDFCYAGNYVALMLREMGRREEALQAARELRRLAPEYMPTAKLLEMLEKDTGGAKREDP